MCVRLFADVRACVCVCVSLVASAAACCTAAIISSQSFAASQCVLHTHTVQTGGGQTETNLLVKPHCGRLYAPQRGMPRQRDRTTPPGCPTTQLQRREVANHTITTSSTSAVHAVGFCFGLTEKVYQKYTPPAEQQ